MNRTPVRRHINKSVYRLISRFCSRRLFSREQDKRSASSLIFSYSARAALREDPGFMTPFSRPPGTAGKSALRLIRQRVLIRLWRLFYASGFTSRKARPAAFISAAPVETKRPRIYFSTRLLYNKKNIISRKVTMVHRSSSGSCRRRSQDLCR